MGSDRVARWRLDLLSGCDFGRAFRAVDELPIVAWLADSLRGYASSLAGKYETASDLFRDSRRTLREDGTREKSRAATALFLQREHHLICEEYVDDEECDDMVRLFLQAMSTSLQKRLIACHLACDAFRHLARGEVDASSFCFQTIVTSSVKSDELKAFVHSCLAICDANRGDGEAALLEVENSGLYVQSSAFNMAHIVGGYRLAAICEFIGEEKRAQEWASFAERIEVNAAGKQSLRDRVERRLAQSIAHSYLFV